jgi:hypothetical protein
MPIVACVSSRVVTKSAVYRAPPEKDRLKDILLKIIVSVIRKLQNGLKSDLLYLLTVGVEAIVTLDHTQ